MVTIEGPFTEHVGKRLHTYLEFVKEKKMEKKTTQLYLDECETVDN